MFFQYFLWFSMTFPVCSKFPDFSLTGKCLSIFPVWVGTLLECILVSIYDHEVAVNTYHNIRRIQRHSYRNTLRNGRMGTITQDRQLGQKGKCHKWGKLFKGKGTETRSMMDKLLLIRILYSASNVPGWTTSGQSQCPLHKLFRWFGCASWSDMLWISL